MSQQLLEVGAREEVGEKQDEGGEGGGIMELGEEEVLDGEENRELLKRLSEQRKWLGLERTRRKCWNTNIRTLHL